MSYTQITQEFNKNALGYSALGIILSTCMGSIAIYTTLMHGNSLMAMGVVMLSVITCNAHNAAILTVQKPKVIFDLLVGSVVVNALIILGGLTF